VPTITRLELLDEAQCLALLATASVGRVGISSSALPAIFPVNFALVDRQVIFRTQPGTKLNAAAAGAVVAFEADRFDDARGEGWSVLVRGLAEEVTGPGEIARWAALVPASWALANQAAHFVRVPVTLISGRIARTRV
jgi:uncharacterized protein